MGFRTIVFIFIVISTTFRFQKEKKRKNLNMSTGSNSCQVRTFSLKVPKIHSELSSRTHGVTVIGVGSLRRQSSGGCRFNSDCRRVTIQEYLTLVPGYG